MSRLIVATALAAAMATSAAAAPPPASAFGRLPVVDTISMAPDGKRVAILGGMPDRRMISIAPIDGDKVVQVNLGRTDVYDVSWSADGYILASALILDRFKDPTNGQEHAYHLYRDLILTPEGRNIGPMLTNSEASVLAVRTPVLWVQGETGVAFVSGLDWSVIDSAGPTRLNRGDGLVWSVWRVDLANGVGRVVEHGSNATYAWAVDPAGLPRVRLDHGDKDRNRVLVRGKGGGAWRQLAEIGGGPGDKGYLAYLAGEDSVYLTEPAADGGLQLVRYGVSDGSMSRIDLGGVKAYSVNLISDPYTEAFMGVRIFGERTIRRWSDPVFAEIYERLSRAFAGKEVYIRDWSKDRTRFLVSVEGPDAAPVWYLYDKAAGQVSLISETYPELKDVVLGKTSWFTYKARDGLEIGAYLTLPPGAPAQGGKLPLIVFPHGGPRSRDYYGFDWWLQFMATRGYAVVQPQFRGSGGFGSAFEQAGRREWAGKMQTDLLDAVADLAARGVIDPQRVCIVGSSFGGYATLAGAAFHPEAYRCAASVNGISDLGMLLGEQIHEFGRDSEGLGALKSMVGEVSGDPLVAAASPARRAQAVTAPVLLVVSSDDTTVAPEQSEKMAAALQKAGKAVQVVTLKGEDHYLSRSATRTQMLEALESFLAKNLPVN